MSDKGHRCEARTRLEFDHVTPGARGGQPTVAGMRLLCRAHNQHAADVAFGRGFMDEKREQARHERNEARELKAAGTASAQAASNAPATTTSPRTRAEDEALTAAALEVIPWLREFGCRPDDARRAVAGCEAIPDVAPEERDHHVQEEPGAGQRATADARRQQSGMTRRGHRLPHVTESADGIVSRP